MKIVTTADKGGVTTVASDDPRPVHEGRIALSSPKSGGKP